MSRLHPRGPRRGHGQRTLFWKEHGRNIQIFVKGPGAVEWARAHGDLLGERWDYGEAKGDYAFVSFREYPGWLAEAKKEYPRVKFQYLQGEYIPREWLSRGATPESSPARRSNVVLPAAALRKMSAAQRSYIDEFTFKRRPNGHIEGWYAGQLLAVWDGKGWQSHSKLGVAGKSSRAPRRSNIRAPNPAGYRYMVIYDWLGVPGGRGAGRATIEEADELAKEARAKGRKNVLIFDRYKQQRAEQSPALLGLRKRHGVKRSIGEFREMLSLLSRKGHPYGKAARLAAIYQAEGMGPHELEHRLRNDNIDTPQSLMRLHDLGRHAKRAASPASSTKRAKVIKANGREQAVKNLGWLLRNWGAVERFEIREPAGGSDFPRCDVLMIAHCCDGVRYETCWASRDTLKQWIHRPVFRGLPVDWLGEQIKA